MSLVNVHKGPSKNLSWKELSCKDGTQYPARFIADGRVFRLAQVFESIREMYGLPIIVLSAYRSITHNRKIGGAKNSQHTHGRALDLAPPAGININHFYEDIRQNVSMFGITGIGRYKTFVHVDIRPGERLVAWIGSGKKDSRS